MSGQAQRDYAQLREDKHSIKDYTPDGSLEKLLPGTFYLEKSDDKYRRNYSVKS